MANLQWSEGPAAILFSISESCKRNLVNEHQASSIVRGRSHMFTTGRRTDAHLALAASLGFVRLESRLILYFLHVSAWPANRVQGLHTHKNSTGMSLHN